MISTEQHDRATLGAHGEPCAQCGAALARDQRYCLACGARRTGLSPMLTDAPLPAPPAVPPLPLPPKPAATPSRWSGDAGVLAGAACLLLALLVGVLIGRAGRDPAPPRAAAPQVITVGAATASATSTPSATATPSPTATATAAKESSPAKKKDAKAIQDIQGATGQDYSKKSAKLPKTLTTPGTPPPKDNKPAGGGSGTETFK